MVCGNAEMECNINFDAYTAALGHLAAVVDLHRQSPIDTLAHLVSVLPCCPPSTVNPPPSAIETLSRSKERAHTSCTTHHTPRIYLG